jgi:hypothetical protein
MKIINVMQGFQNAYNQKAIWQVWNGSDLVGLFSTRKAAREFVKDFNAQLSQGGSL